MSADELLRVVRGGYCVGCGACAVVADGISVGPDRHGFLRATLDGAAPASLEAAARVCPWSGRAPDEDALGERLAADGAVAHDQLGRHLTCHVGHVSAGTFRASGSSGGLTSWVLTRLLETGRVDKVIHVAADPTGEHHFTYRVARTTEDVRAGAGSRYYPVTLATVLRELRETGGRAALVGVPCFIRAAHALRREVPELSDRIAVTVAIFCGHLKSRAFAEAAAWQLGVEPAALAEVDFRVKLPGRPANRYGITVRARGGQPITSPWAELDVADWGAGLFRYRACDYCDDVVGEAADISIGDAWLPGWVEDSRGTNAVVARSRDLAELLEAGRAEGELSLTPVDAGTIVQSQAAGFRHRRDALAHRLARDDAAGVWRPPKRVRANPAALSSVDAAIADLRVELRDAGPPAFEAARAAGSYAHFRDALRPLLDEHRRLVRRRRRPPKSLLARLLGRVRRLFSRGRKK